MMKTLNDYRAMSYRMEIAEDKDEGNSSNMSTGYQKSPQSSGD